MDTEAIQKWVLEVHAKARPALDEAMQADGDVTSAESDAGLWWAVLNVESPDYEPESMWTDPAEAQRHADGLNAGRHPSWQVVPAAVAWWMRNEVLPEGLEPKLGRGSAVEPRPDMLSAEAVLKAVNRRRAAALANARAEEFASSTRAESGAQAHALTLVLRDLGLEAEDGKQTQSHHTPAGLLEAVGPRISPVERLVEVARRLAHGEANRIAWDDLDAALAAYDAAKGGETLLPVSPTWPYVLRFAGQMESMLDCNREKGDRPGWLAAWPRALANDALRNLRELTALLTVSDPADNSDYDHAAIARRAANVANFCMMVTDRCGALVLPGERMGPSSESQPKRLTAARIERDSPDTIAAFVPSVSYEGSPGCESKSCRAFILGVEVGRLGARLQDLKPEEWSGTYHASNQEMLTRVASAWGYSSAFESSGEPTWLFATFSPKVSPPRLAMVPPREALHLFRESNSGETYAARDLEHAKALEAATPGHDADDIPLWVAEPDDKAITVDDDGTKVTKTAAEWANEMQAPGLCFNTLP